MPNARVSESALRANPEAWKAEWAERRAWEMTLADGLEGE